MYLLRINYLKIMAYLAKEIQATDKELDHKLNTLGLTVDCSLHLKNLNTTTQTIYSTDLQLLSRS